MSTRTARPKTGALLEGCGFTATYDKPPKPWPKRGRKTPEEPFPLPKNGVLHGRIGQVADFYRKTATDSFGWRSPANERVAIEKVDNHQLYFAGGSHVELMSDLNGHKRMNRFDERLRELRGNGWLASLSKELSFHAPKRRRNFSEHDGDFAHDRRFEISPFSSTTRQSGGVKRHVTIDAELAYLGHMSSGAIDEYGATVWALVQVLEESGISVDLIGTNICERLSSKDDDPFTLETRITLKSAGEYVSPNFLAAALSANFYRRAIFRLRSAVTDQAGHSINDGFGASIICKSVSWHQGDILKLSAGPLLEAAMHPDKLVETLIGNIKQTAA